MAAINNESATEYLPAVLTKTGERIKKKRYPIAKMILLIELSQIFALPKKANKTVAVINLIKKINLATPLYYFHMCRVMVSFDYHGMKIEYP